MTPNMVYPTVAAAICRQPARRAGIVVRLHLCRPTQKRLSLYGVIPFNKTGYIYHGASPWRGWMALGQRRYICTVYRVLSFTRTSCFCHVAGGRLPPLLARMGWYRSTARGVFGIWHVSGFSPQAFHGLWNFSVDGAWIFESSENIWALLSLYPLSFAAQFLFPAVFLLKFLHIL